MRKKEAKCIVTFPSTIAALAMEQRAKQMSLPGRLIPTPVAITASCGLAWMCDVTEEACIRAALAENGMEFSAVQVVLL